MDWKKILKTTMFTLGSLVVIAILFILGSLLQMLPPHITLPIIGVFAFVALFIAWYKQLGGKQ